MSTVYTRDELMIVNPCVSCGSTPAVQNDPMGNTLRICLCADKIEDLVKYWNMINFNVEYYKDLLYFCRYCRKLPSLEDNDFYVWVQCPCDIDYPRVHKPYNDDRRIVGARHDMFILAINEWNAEQERIL